jgi:hypothetical protein
VGLAKEDRFLQVEGDAAAAILRAAQETPCDLIVRMDQTETPRGVHWWC